jgi:hypothetical protein
MTPEGDGRMLAMASEWTITLTRDEALVLADYLHRWSETKEMAFEDEAERTALDNLLCLLESADDGTAFSKDYAEQVAAARKRLRPEV